MKTLFSVIISLGMLFTKAFAVEGDAPPQIGPPPPEPPGVPEWHDPWLTGPLISPAAHIVPAGYVNFEPYLIYTSVSKIYDNNWNSFTVPTFQSVNFQTPLWVGLTEWMDIVFFPQATWNGTQGVSSMEFNDFAVELDFQILTDTRENSLPAVKIAINESFPTGRYQNRNPDKLGTDIGGSGSYVTTIGLALSRLFHIYEDQWFSARFNALWSIPARVSVKGINTYGGAPDTKARVKPGQELDVLIGLEYSITQNWALAFDAVANWGAKTTFTGNAGTNADLSAPPLSILASLLELNISMVLHWDSSPALGFRSQVKIQVVSSAD